MISACLLGMRTRYDGDSRPAPDIPELAGNIVIIPICPEVMGGLPTPRPPAEIYGGDGDDVLNGDAKVIRRDGIDVTAEYLRGTERVRERALSDGVKTVYLKDKSPACGCGHIKRHGRTVRGYGVCAAALAREGIRIIPI